MAGRALGKSNQSSFGFFFPAEFSRLNPPPEFIHLGLFLGRTRLLYAIFPCFTISKDNFSLSEDFQAKKN